MNRETTVNDFVSVTQGNYHQGDLKFDVSAGKQCYCMALTSIGWSTVRKLTLWKEYDLDFILENGDKLFRSQKVERKLYIDEIPGELLFEN